MWCIQFYVPGFCSIFRNVSSNFKYILLSSLKLTFVTAFTCFSRLIVLLIWTLKTYWDSSLWHFYSTYRQWGNDKWFPVMSIYIFGVNPICLSQLVSNKMLTYSTHFCSFSRVGGGGETISWQSSMFHVLYENYILQTRIWKLFSCHSVRHAKISISLRYIAKQTKPFYQFHLCKFYSKFSCTSLSKTWAKYMEHGTFQFYSEFYILQWFLAKPSICRYSIYRSECSHIKYKYKKMLFDIELQIM